MTDDFGTGVDPQAAIDQAKAEIYQEKHDKAVELLKGAYSRKAQAEQVVANVEREIADLEQAIKDGNVDELIG